MNRKFYIHYALILFALIQSCDTRKSLDRQAIKEEIENREIKRITESQFMEKGMEIGNLVSDQAQKILQENLMKAISEGGVHSAIEFCNLNASGLVNALEKESGVQIYRTSQKFRNPGNEPDSLELLILEAYSYSHENGQELTPSIIAENDQVLLYSRPITIAGGLCLNCHGNEEIQEDVRETLAGFYPSDQAVDYKLGDFRGMWSIRIPKKVIAEAL